MQNQIMEILRQQHKRQIDLAEALDVTRATVHRWVYNQMQPSDEMKLRISDYLGVPVGEIFFGQVCPCVQQDDTDMQQ